MRQAFIAQDAMLQSFQSLETRAVGLDMKFEFGKWAESGYIPAEALWGASPALPLFFYAVRSERGRRSSK